MKDYKSWLVLFCAPLLINGLVWRVLVVPQRAALQVWRDHQAVTELRPRLETLVAESQKMLTEGQRRSVFGKDPAFMTKTIQDLAGKHHVQIQKIHANDRGGGLARGPLPGLSAMPIEVEASGNFNKLARWMNDLESQIGFQMDSWTLTAGQGPDQPHRLAMKMTAFVRGT